MQSFINEHPFILMEAAVVEQLRRSNLVDLHPSLVNALLIYEKAGRRALRKTYQGYMDIALKTKTPFLMCAPTWRANHDRVKTAKADVSINQDAVRFMQDLREIQPGPTHLIKIGGMMGCKNDCYKPEEALTAVESEQFHIWQIDQLAQASPDFLMAATLPNVEEAKGIAKAMEESGIPYIISFVISREGRVLDGTDLQTAIDQVDGATIRTPLGYMINCAYPTFLCAEQQPAAVFNRLIGYQGNASSRDHCDLDNADELQSERVEDWGDAMVNLNRSFGIKILGGCCGTGNEHLQYIVDNGH